MPLYYLIYCLSCPITNFRAADSRLTNMAYTASILPTTVIGFYAPYLLAYISPTLSLRHTGIWVWHLFPLWISLGQWILSRAVMPNSLQHDRLHRPSHDIRTIRTTIGTLTVFSALVYLFCVTSTNFTLVDIFLPLGTDHHQSFETAIREFLQWDQIYFAGASLLWVVCLFAELRRAELTTMRWPVVLVLLGCLSVVFGTGAATAVGWLWREEILVRRTPAEVVAGGGAVGKREKLGLE